MLDLMFRPLTVTDMQSIISRTYDIKTNQLISSTMCTPYVDSSPYAEDPVQLQQPVARGEGFARVVSVSGLY